MEELKKMIVLTIIYGGLTLISGKGSSGNLVRFSCALGMLVFLSGKISNIFAVEMVDIYDNSVIEQSVQQGKKKFDIGLNKEISDYIEKDILSICRKYGADGDVEVSLKIKNGQAEIETIGLVGNFESAQGIGFIKNEIMNTYGIDEVKIIEK